MRKGKEEEGEDDHRAEFVPVQGRNPAGGWTHQRENQGSTGGQEGWKLFQ